MDYIEKMNYVQKPEYEQWIYNYLQTHKYICDDPYEKVGVTPEDQTNAALISFYEAFKLTGESVPIEVEGFPGFYQEFKINEQNFIIETIIGQGSITTILKKEDYEFGRNQ